MENKKNYEEEIKEENKILTKDFVLKNKHILVITTTDNMIWQFLIPHIKLMEENGNIVDCVCAKTGFFYDELKEKFGLNMHQFDFSRFPFTIKNLKSYKKLKDFVKQNKFDLIYCHQPVGGVFGRKIAKCFNIPVIYVAHGFHFYKGCPFKNKLIYKTIEKHYSKNIEALVTMNQEDFEIAKTFKAKNVYKINGVGIDLSKYDKDAKFDENVLREELNLKTSDFVVLSVGELNKNKNTLMLIDSIKYLKEDFLSKNCEFNIKYLICGQGPLKQQYEEKIALNGLENDIKLLGFRKDISHIIQISNVFIMPSFREGLPKTIMECMVQGLPIVASNIRGCKDLIGNNEGGILCNPANKIEFADAIKMLYNDNNFYKIASNRNAEFIKNYSIDEVLNELNEILSNINFDK